VGVDCNGCCDAPSHRLSRRRPQSPERPLTVAETPGRLSGAGNLLHRSGCGLYRGYSSSSPPRHLKARPQNQSCGALQLHVTAAGLAAGAFNVLVLEEARQSHRSHQVFHLSLQPHQGCSMIKIALADRVLFRDGNRWPCFRDCRHGHLKELIQQAKRFPIPLIPRVRCDGVILPLVERSCSQIVASEV